MVGDAPLIRNAEVADLRAISDIYNHYVLASTATFATSAETLDERVDWFEDHLRSQLPMVVMEAGAEVIAWGSLSFYHSRCAYRNSLEPSVYVHRDHVKKGLGRAMMSRLIELARERDGHCLVGLACSENEPSIRMSESLGFKRVGELREVGYKFDRWLDVTMLQLML